MMWGNATGLRTNKLIGIEGRTEGNDLGKCRGLAVI